MKSFALVFTLAAFLALMGAGCGDPAAPKGGDGKKEGGEKTGEPAKKAGEDTAEKAPEEPAEKEAPGISAEEFAAEKEKAGKSIQALFIALERGDLDGAEDLVKTIQENTVNNARYTPRQNAEMIEDYKAGAEALRAKLEELRAAAADKDAERILALARETGGLCKGCHEAFKPKEEEGH